MRTFFIFKIKSNFSYMYKNNPYKMFKIIEELYHTKKYDMVLTYKYFEQIAYPFDKKRLNELLYKKYKIDKYYSNISNKHIIANNNEYSRLIINNSNLKIVTNLNYSIFFKDIYEYSDNLFICDFINRDYFWLDKIIKKDRQNDDNLVKLV